MNQQDDRRLLPSHERLHGLTLVYQPWNATDPHNDHDHCEFCWAKFAAYNGCLRAGYATEDCYRWICEDCFRDFKERFKWKVK